MKDLASMITRRTSLYSHEAIIQALLGPEHSRPIGSPPRPTGNRHAERLNLLTQLPIKRQVAVVHFED